MVVRVHNLTKWRCLLPGSALNLGGDAFRKFRFEVNCVAPTRFDLLDADGARTFLAVVQGLEVLEFSTGAGSSLIPSTDEEVWYFTNDGDEIATGASAEAVPFTKIMQRKSRNRELEFMMMKAEQRMNRRLNEQAGEIAAMRESMVERGIDPDTGEVIDNGERPPASPEPASPPAGEPPVPPAVEPKEAGATDGK